MTIEKAVAYAFINICDEKGLRPSSFEDLNLSTSVYRIMNGTTKKPSITTIHGFCCATGYTLEEFFARKEFDDLE